MKFILRKMRWFYPKRLMIMNHVIDPFVKDQ